MSSRSKELRTIVDTNNEECTINTYIDMKNSILFSVYPQQITTTVTISGIYNQLLNILGYNLQPSGNTFAATYTTFLTNCRIRLSLSSAYHLTSIPCFVQESGIALCADEPTIQFYIHVPGYTINVYDNDKIVSIPDNIKLPITYPFKSGSSLSLIRDELYLALLTNAILIYYDSNSYMMYFPNRMMILPRTGAPIAATPRDALLLSISDPSTSYNIQFIYTVNNSDRSITITIQNGAITQLTNT